MKKDSLKALTTAAVLAMGVLSAPCATSAVDMFLKIGDIKGESQDYKHKDEIDVLAWSWGISQSGRAGSGRVVGKVCVQDISLTKLVDKATPSLLMGTTIGRLYPNAILVVRKAGDSPLEYLTIDMRNVMVTSVSTGSTGAEDRLTENVTLNFTEVEWTYVEANDKGAPINSHTATITSAKVGCN
jgi:type VI secretion system secreted protein Hcp